MRNGLLPSMPRFLMAKVAKHSQEGWEQLKWVEAICTACSQVFIHPSILRGLRASQNLMVTGVRSQQVKHGLGNSGPVLQCRERTKSHMSLNHVSPWLQTPKPSQCPPGMGPTAVR